jgi:hypothetical protein
MQYQRQHLIIRAVLGLALALGFVACGQKKISYTIPQVTQTIEDDVRQVRDLKNRGKLAKASEQLAKIAKRVITEFPEATVTQEPVKKLIDALDWMSNLCLDKALELKQESITGAEDKLSKKFQEWADEHRESVVKLRRMLPNLKSAQVAPRATPPARPGDATPPPAMAPDAAGMEPGAAGMEPGAGEPGAREPGGETPPPEMAP